MEMVICPECHKKTPPDINRCVRCNATLITESKPANIRGDSRVVTIEATSKSIKGRYLASVALCGMGIVVAMAGDGSVRIAGVVIFWIGLIWYFITRFNAWWHHG